MPRVKKEKNKKITASSKKMGFLAILVIFTFMLGYRFKGIIVAATVNGRPIYSFQFLKRTLKSYGQRTLDDLISEKLVTQEAEKQGLTVSDEEATEEIETLTQELGGQSALEDLLKSQGLNSDEFEKRIEIQLLIEKLLEKDLSITEMEVEAFINQYGTQMEATNEASKKEEAREILRSQKLNEAYANFFPELKEKAKISQFLEF